MPALNGENNVYLTDDVIAKEALRLLKNELIATRYVHRDHEQRFGKIGDTISIKLPSRIKSASGRTLVKQPMVDRTTTLKVNKQEHVGLEFNSVDRTLSLHDFSERHMKSGISQIAHQVDLSIIEKATVGGFFSSGTPGVAVNTDTFIDARAAMTMIGHPNDGMSMHLLNPLDAAEVRKDLKTLYNPQEAQDAVRKAMCGNLAGFESYETAQMVPHIVGDYGGTPLVAGASQTGNTLNIDGGSTSTTGFLLPGDVFTIAGVFSINPRTYRSTGLLQQFTVVAAADTDGSGATQLTISPEVNDGTLTTLDAEGNTISLAAYQNVTNAPADNAPITVMGNANTAYRQNLTMHRDAVALACVDMHLPQSAPVKARVRDEQSGLSIMMTAQYNINEMEETYRMDVLWGVDAVYPELIRRTWGLAG